MEDLEKVIGYRFQDKKYLDIALTHSSYANEAKNAGPNNERQEFLGDAVLSLIVADYIFRHRKVPEGELTKIRASLVCESADVYKRQPTPSAIRPRSKQTGKRLLFWRRDSISIIPARTACCGN